LQLPHRPRQEVVLYYYLFKTTSEYVAWKTEHRKRKEAAEADRYAACAWLQTDALRRLPTDAGAAAAIFASGARHQ